jgi:hypothetical protein
VVAFQVCELRVVAPLLRFCLIRRILELRHIQIITFNISIKLVEYSVI